MKCYLTYDENSVFLDWQHAISEEGISHYRVYMNGVLSKNVDGKCNQYIFNNLEQGKEYEFFVIGVTNNERLTGVTDTASITLPSSENELSTNLNTYI